MIEALGNGALPGSKGLLMIQAKRAAELDAYRKMAERFIGLKISRDSSVRELCLKNDTLIASVTAFLKGLKPVSIEYNDDLSCEVTIQLKIREVIETVETLVKMSGKNLDVTEESIKEVNREINDKTFTVTGVGAPPENSVSESVKPSSSADRDDIYTTERKIIKTIIHQKIVVE